MKVPAIRTEKSTPVVVPKEDSDDLDEEEELRLVSMMKEHRDRSAARQASEAPVKLRRLGW